MIFFVPHINSRFSPPGFEGCITALKFDGESLPFSGETDKFTIATTGSVNATCPEVLPVQDESGGLAIAIIIIIVFFAVVLVAIVTTFVVCWYRRSKGLKNTGLAFWTKKSHINGDVISSSKSNGGQSVLSILGIVLFSVGNLKDFREKIIWGLKIVNLSPKFYDQKDKDEDIQ